MIPAGDLRVVYINRKPLLLPAPKPSPGASS